MTFSPTGKIDPETGKQEHRCGSCDLRIWTTRPNVICDCPGLRGLGDAVHAALGIIGIKAKGCGGCKRRRNKLNTLLPFKRNRPSKP